MARPAKKHLGQHFLHDPAVIQKLLMAIDPATRDSIVEIGGGHGALTLPLSERVRSLHVIELDRELAAWLVDHTAGAGRVTVHHADALKFDYSALADGAKPLRIVGNLPYNISTPLLFHLLEYRSIIEDMHVMLQKEVVERMTASPGGRVYGRLTVMLAAWTDIEACFDIGPGAFSPPPQVRSTFVRIRLRRTASFAVKDEARFAALVAHLFSMRRKTIARSLKGRLAPQQIEALGIDPRARPETLQPGDFARLADLWR